MGKIKLFCLPYAGGSALVYNQWKSYLDPQIDLIPIELAGRGTRMGQALYPDISAAVDDVFQFVTEKSDGLPYLLFGHSMGAQIAYELGQRMLQTAIQLPAHIFFSGCRAPHIPERKKKYHLMGDEEFRKELLGLGGTPPEFFEHPELLDIFLPLLRNDFKIVETHPAKKNGWPMPFPITVFFGKQDDISAKQCDGWKEHTLEVCSMYHFEGGHFFLQEHVEQLVQFINITAQNYIVK